MPERPAADARIEVRTRGLTTRSEPNGRFRLVDVPPGEYVVVTRALGFDLLVDRDRHDRPSHGPRYSFRLSASLIAAFSRAMWAYIRFSRA